MKTMDSCPLSGFTNTDLPGWLLMFVLAAVAVLLLVCAALVALVLVRWLRLWRRSRGLRFADRPFGPAILDDLGRHSHFARDRQDPLMQSYLSAHEEIAFLETSDSHSGGMLP